MEGIIKSIPDLLLYFIPGFIALRMKEIYGFQKKHDKFFTTVFSFLYSFIVMVLYMIVVNFLKWVIPSFGVGVSEQLKLVLRIVFSMLVGVGLGKVITSSPKSILGRRFGKRMNPESTPDQTVLEAALNNHPYGAYATIYLKNGMKYHGSIGENTSEPDEPEKALLLYDYCSWIKVDKVNMDEKGNPIDPYMILKESSRDTELDEERERVYLKLEDIIAIEVKPVTKEEAEKVENAE